MTLLVALLLLADTQQGSPPATAQRFEQAAQAREQGNAGEAERLYREGVRLHPDWGEGWWYLGRLFYDRNSYEECRGAFLRFTEIEPKVGSGWAALGLCEYGIKSYDSSRAHLERGRSLGLEGNPQLQAIALYHAALLLTQSGEFEAALGILMRLAAKGRETPSLVEAAGMAGLRKALPPSELPPTERELVLQAGRALMDAGAHPAGPSTKGV
jgi:tetratricopeptide (TPR) repeat protein